MIKADDIERAINAIDHGCDGPITPFVLVARATEAVAKGGDPDVYANAVFEALCARGWITDRNALVETGS